MAIKTKFKMPKEGNKVKVTFTNGEAKLEKTVYAVTDKNGEIDVAKTEARIEYVCEMTDLPYKAKKVNKAPVEEVNVEEVIEEVIEAKECCDDVCEECK